MEIAIHIKMNEKLFLRDPEHSDLGRKIVKSGLELINKLGFEDFTFKKLANTIKTTEASIYRYFENKHKLLIYLITFYWSYIEFKIVFSINNITTSEKKLKKIVELLVNVNNDNDAPDYISVKKLHDLVMWEGSKAYLTRHVGADNKEKLFKPYKDLCARLSDVILEYNNKYKFPHSLASTIVEMSHAQKFFKQNLPSLTDFAGGKDDAKLITFLETLLFSALKTN